MQKVTALAASFFAITALAWLKVIPYGVGAIAEALTAAFAFVLQYRMREPDRHSAREHAWLATGGTVLLTWSASAAIAFGFEAWAPIDARAKQGLFALVLLVAPNVGGIFALTRSVRTRSETGATLRELSTIRVATLSTPVIEESVRLYEAADVGDLVKCVTRMLRLAVTLPLTRDFLDKAALWVRDDGRGVWFIVASSNLQEDFDFTMPIVSAPTPNEGIVANLAVAGPPAIPDCAFERDVFLCGKGLRAHPWYKANSGTTAEAMAAVMLRDGDEVVGVVSLTTSQADLVPLQGTKRAELVDVLRFWSHSFLVAVRHLRAVRPTAGVPDA